MNGKVLIVGIVLLLIMVTGCDVVRDAIVLEGSGNIIEIDEEISGFNRLEVGYSFEAGVGLAAAQAVLT